MQQLSVRKMYKYKLNPTPEQQPLLERTLMLCRHVYNAAVGERHEAWRMRGVTVTYYQQKAELPGIKEAMPEYLKTFPRNMAIYGQTWTNMDKHAVMRV
jgi:transposase